MATAEAAKHTTVTVPAETGTARLYSLDAFRGMTMIWMISEGFGFLFFKDHALLGGLARQFTHHEWHGVYAWDLIQPFFMFIVGVTMPFSFTRRWEAGQSWAQTLRHVLKRCALLALLGTMARSIGAGRPVLDLINVLGQLAFVYFFAFLVLRGSARTQAAAAFGFLAAHWAIFQFSAGPGVTGPWDKDANIGWYLDRLILGKNWSGGYVTINFIPETATTIFGVLAGWVLIRPRSDRQKLAILAGWGLGSLAAGLALDPLIPGIKRIWTASFALHSAGYCLLALAAFYWLCDVKKRRKWARLFVVVGMNSIFIYLFHEILRKWLNQTGLVFTGWAVQSWGPWGQMLNVCLVIAFQIYVCCWLYRRKIFFKL